MFHSGIQMVQRLKVRLVLCYQMYQNEVRSFSWIFSLFRIITWLIFRCLVEIRLFLHATKWHYIFLELKIQDFYWNSSSFWWWGRHYGGMWGKLNVCGTTRAGYIFPWSTQASSAFYSWNKLDTVGPGGQYLVILPYIL